MDVLELKPIKNKKVIAYIFAKENSESLQYIDVELLTTFLKKEEIDFVIINFDIDMKEFSKTPFAVIFEKLGIKYVQGDIPEYAMGYLYEEIIEKEELFNSLVDEYQNLKDRDSYKGQSLKNWIDLINSEIQEKENFLSLRLRPMWIVKKMLDFVKSFKAEEVKFVYLVQKDICEDICSQVVDLLRDFNVKVIQYNKKHLIKNIIL